MEAGYIAVDGEVTTGAGITVRGKLGADTRESAIMFCQLALPKGESFEIYNCPRESWHDFPCIIFLTAEGYLRLDELERRKTERRRKRMDYFVSLIVAVLVALISSYLTHLYATRRAETESARQG